MGSVSWVRMRVSMGASRIGRLSGGIGYREGRVNFIR